MLKTLIIQAQMKHYRVPFFEGLHRALKSEEIELTVAYSDPPASESSKGDSAELPQEFSIKVPGLWFMGERVLYQPLLRVIADADLVIVEHANKHVVNHILLLLNLIGVKRLAFWGLGSNKQSDKSELSEWFKKLTARKVDWYFAYTRGVAEEAEKDFGFPRERITAVQNSVDTRELQKQVAMISASERLDLRQSLGIEADDRVGVYCGMLDPVKGLDLLIASAKLIKQSIPKFHLLLLGGGREEQRVRSEVSDLPWIHVLGPKFGEEKARYFAISDAFLLPGRVGLVILDCFAAHLPLLTVGIPIHGPEIEYLEEGKNGYMVEANAQTYADCVVRVFGDETLLNRLRAGAATSAQKYSIESMIENFRSGVVQCLSPQRNTSMVRASQ